MKDYILTKENEEEQNKEKNKDKYFNGDNNETETKVVDNHIYYYSSVNKKSALELNMKLREVENKLLKKYIYPYVKDCSEASKRIECWCNFSYECEIINNIKINQISINNSGLSVELHQSLIKRIPHQRGDKQNSFLEELNIALNCAWKSPA